MVHILILPCLPVPQDPCKSTHRPWARHLSESRNGDSTVSTRALSLTGDHGHTSMPAPCVPSIPVTATRAHLHAMRTRQHPKAPCDWAGRKLLCGGEDGTEAHFWNPPPLLRRAPMPSPPPPPPPPPQSNFRVALAQRQAAPGVKTPCQANNEKNTVNMQQVMEARRLSEEKTLRKTRARTHTTHVPAPRHTLELFFGCFGRGGGKGCLGREKLGVDRSLCSSLAGLHMIFGLGRVSSWRIVRKF